MAVRDYGTGERDIDDEDLERQLREAAEERGVEYDDSDLEGIYRNISYDDDGLSLDDALEHQLGIYDMRRDNTPGEEYDEDGDGSGGGGGGGRFGGRFDDYPRDGGAEATERQMDEILAAIKAMNVGPDVDLSMIDPGAFPQFTVPGEDMSPAIDDTLLDLMEGDDPYNITALIGDLLARTAGDEGRLNRAEAARENLTRGSQTALADMRGTLADRGLISLPGSPEGAETDATVRTLEPLQRAYLAELRESENDADSREVEALTIATGWTKDQVDRRLSAAQTAQERQQVMSDIALGVLDRNMAWNKFLAEFGLKREELAEQIRSGRMAAVLPALQMFQALLQQSRGGFIGR